MFSWLFIVAVAYFLNAIVFLIDKYLLSQKIPNPIVYSFYVGLLSFSAILLIPLGFLIPSWPEIFINLITGAIFIIALVFFYLSIRYNEPSRVIPVIGGFVAFFTLILSYIFLNERLTRQVLLALLLLLAGSILITLRKTTKKKQKRIIKKFGYALFASFVFAVFYVLTKYIYLHQPFLSGFIWPRIGSGLVALSLLILPVSRREILSISKKVKKPTTLLFLSNQILAGLAFVLINYAISLTSVSLIKTLEGLQYLFVLILSLILATRYKKVLVEEINKSIIFQKIVAILLISAGLFILSIQ